MHYLMEDPGTHQVNEKDLPWLEGDSVFAVVVGRWVNDRPRGVSANEFSEPTTAALLYTFCELAKHPEHIEMIYDEVKDVDVRDTKRLGELQHLNAVINESLRLWPVLLTGGMRKTTAQSLRIGDVAIPPHTTIVAPKFCISRREDCFERAHDFVPERWYKYPEMIRNVAAFTPYGTGQRSCLGRGLAADVLRLVTARMAKKYRFRIPPGQSELRTTEDLKDQFTPNPGVLPLLFELREDGT